MKARDGQAQYAELEPRIRDAASRADEQALADLELEWVQVQQRTGAMPGAASDEAVAGAFQWLAQQRAARARDAAFAQEVELLERVIDSRGAEIEVSRQLGVVKSHDRELPPGLEQRVQYHLRSIQAARQRRLVMRIASVTAIVVALASIVWWRIQRADADAAARQIAAQIDQHLDRVELEQAEDLLIRNAALAQEAPLVAAASRVRERKPAWQEDRELVRALFADIEAAVVSPVRPGKRADFDSRLKLLESRMSQPERQRVAELQRKVVDQVNAYVATLRDQFSAEAETWRKQSTEVPSLDRIPPADAYSIPALEQIVKRASELSAAGAKLCQEHGELPPDALAGARAEIDRLRKVADAASERQKAIGEFESRYAAVLALAGDPDACAKALDALLSEHASVVAGLGLSNSLRAAREADIAALQITKTWNAMVKSLSGSRILEGPGVPPPEQMEALRKFTEEKQVSDLTKVARAILGVLKVNSRDGGMGVGERMGLHLDELGIGDLKVVPLEGGGRVWRRMAEPDGLFGSGVLLTREDAKRAELPGITPAPKRLTGVRIEQAPSSVRVEGLKTALAGLGLIEVRQRMLAAIGDIASVQPTPRPGDEGNVFRLWVVLNLAEVWQQELRPEEPLPADKEIERIAAEIREKHQLAVDFDWGRPLLSAAQLKLATEADAAAAKALSAFANVGALATKDREQLRSLARGLTARNYAGLVMFDSVKKKAALYAVKSRGPFHVFEPDGETIVSRRIADTAALLKEATERRWGPMFVFSEEAAK
jgi:hypothetical protein